MTPASTSLPLPPGPRGHWLLGMLPALRRDMLGLYTDLAHDYGDIATVTYLGVKSVVVFHPDYHKHILQDNNRNYRRYTLLNNIFQRVLGLNLFTADGDDWLSRRRLMQPAFHRQRLASLGALMTAAAQALVTEWAQLPEGHRLDLDQEMMRVTLRIVGQALFSADLLGTANTLGEAFTGASEYINYRLNTPFAPPTFWPNGPNRKLLRAERAFNETIYALLRERRAHPADHADLLAMLMQARDEETGAGMSDENIRNEVLTLMFAGHETTAVTLTWAWYLLAQHPEAERQLHAELSAVLGDRAPTLADLPQLPYTRMVIDETLRLYPPAFGITRQSLAADEIGPYRIPANVGVTLIFYQTHRDPRWWDNPDRFDPTRFAPARAPQRPPYAYAPFGGGPRLCIGNQFALTEAQLVLASVAQRYQLRLVPGHPVKPQPVFVLRPSHGLPMFLHRRA